jgi:hypothetical protein
MRPIKFITRSAALAAACSIVAMSPASATQFTQSHFTIDNDTVAVGKNPNNSFKAFSGTLESFHTGSHIRGELKGDFIGTGTLTMKSILRDTTFTETWSNAGTDVKIDVLTDQFRDLLRVEMSFAPSNGASLTNLSQTLFVGDSPDSTGTCDQLDADGQSVANAQASYQGRVVWRCNADGHIVAHVTGTLTRKSGATKDSYIGGHIEYADGSTSAFLSRVVTASTTTQSLVPVDSDPAKQARRVDVTVFGDSSNQPMNVVKLGDA